MNWVHRQSPRCGWDKEPRRTSSRSRACLSLISLLSTGCPVSTNASSGGQEAVITLMTGRVMLNLAPHHIKTLSVQFRYESFEHFLVGEHEAGEIQQTPILSQNSVWNFKFFPILKKLGKWRFPQTLASMFVFSRTHSGSVRLLFCHCCWGFCH